MAILLDSEAWIQQLCLFVTAAAICIIGLKTNVFIVGVSAIDLLKGRPLTSADLLITAIGVSRIIFQFATLLNMCRITFRVEYPIAYNIANSMIVSSSTYSNIWLSVLQSVFYSLKISNFHNVLFLCLKKIISQRVLGMTILFVLLSIGYTSAEILTIITTVPKNSTQDDDNFHRVQFIGYRVFLLWNALPFLFYAGSSFLLLGSLGHHMYRMRRDNNVTAHLDAYTRTITFTIVSFCCFALYVSFNMFGKDFVGLLGLLLVGNSFLMLHSMYLIYMTARLRGQCLKILHCVTKCLLPRRGAESRSGLQMQVVGQ